MFLSVCLITYNEDRVLKNTLDAVQEIADEIIIVDSYSTDKTKEIADNYTKLKFYEKKFEGFGNQKQFALEKCSHEWVLFIDADEIPDEVCIESIRKIKHEGSKTKVFEIEFENYIFEKRIKRGGWNNVFRIRFFQRESVHFSKDNVHEKTITSSNIGKLAGKIRHYTYQDISHHIAKMNSYSELMAIKKMENGKTASIFSIIVNPVFNFVKNYIFRLGFLDGYLGFYSAVVLSFYTFMKYSKLRQKTKNQR